MQFRVHVPADALLVQSGMTHVSRARLITNKQPEHRQARAKIPVPSIGNASTGSEVLDCRFPTACYCP